MRRKRTCQRSIEPLTDHNGRTPCENTTGRQLQPHIYLSFLSPTPEPASGVVVVVLLLLGERGGFVPYVCLLLMSAISPYIPSYCAWSYYLNSPMHPQKCTQDVLFSGALGTFACYVEYLLLVVLC